MKYRRLKTAEWIILAAMLISAALSIAACLFFSVYEEKPLYAEAVNAAERMQDCMDAVKAEKTARGIEIPPEDLLQTGLIGEDFNFITTTLGDIEAKRTTCSTDMAAMMVFMLDEAGLKAGDVLGCNFSGSFPALNIAVLCACEALDIKPVYICSCGASTWGANNPGLSFPEMAALLYEAGLVSRPPALITPGGGDDVAGGIDSDTFAGVWERVLKLGYPTMQEKDFEKNVQLRRQLFDAAGIDCFLAGGGNITSLGENMVTDLLGQGIIREKINRVNSGSGLLELYLYERTSCILLLNIRKLAAEYSVPFDPATPAMPGTGAVYFEVSRPAAPLAVGLAAEIALLMVYRKKSGRGK